MESWGKRREAVQKGDEQAGDKRSGTEPPVDPDSYAKTGSVVTSQVAK